MSSPTQISRAVRHSLMLGAVATAAGMSAVAQQQLAESAPAPASPAPEEIVVTGSRLATPNLTAISPVTTVTATDIQKTGLTRTEDILNQMPMVFAGQNATVSNAADGTATVDLRGLGPARTLVLVNGRRLGPGAGDGRNFSDINEIPSLLIDRIDIETGGASSVYGADAVAGVVNFVLNTHFEGVKIDANYSFYRHDNGNAVASVVSDAGYPLPPSTVNTGASKNFAIVMGSNFNDNKGNATLYVTYDRSAAVLESQYDYTACSLSAKASTGGFACGGSGTAAKIDPATGKVAGGYFQAYGALTVGADGKPINKPIYTNTVDPTTGAFRPFTGSDLYNFGPLNFLQRPNERWTSGAFLNYAINDNLTVYGEVMLTRNNSQAQIAGSGDFFVPTFIPCTNPQLTQQEHDVLCDPANLAAQALAGYQTSETVNGVTIPGALLYIGRRNLEGGGRVASFTSDSQRALVGLKGQITDGITFDVYASHTTVDSTSPNLNYFSNDLIANALNTIGVDANGNPVSVYSPGTTTANCALSSGDSKCVPWNIWVPGGVTKAATDYLSVPLLTDLTLTEYVVSGSVTADLSRFGGKLPTADDGILLNVGAEWRSDSASITPDYVTQLGNAAGSGGPTPPISGNIHVSETFFEAGVPLIQHKPFAESVSLNLGYRYSTYSLDFETNTYKFGVEWSPDSSVRLRASYQRAVRAPNINELYNPQVVALDGSSDPCAAGLDPSDPNKLTSGVTFAQCALTGVTPGQFGNIAANSAAQYNGKIGGNPDLQPEKADTYSVGLVFKPTFVPNLSASIDYFNIKIKDAIGAVGADNIINGCINGITSFCSAIHRDPNTGSLWKGNNGYIVDPLVNLGAAGTKGFDLTANYKLGIGPLGALLFDFAGTRVISLDTAPLATESSYDCTNLFGITCGNPSPSWRHRLTTTWQTPWNGLDFGVRWRYFGKVYSQALSSYSQLNDATLPLGANIPAYNWIDLTSSVSLAKGVRLQLGINNLFDKDPPVVDSGAKGLQSKCPTGPCNGNIYPAVYDSLGRYIYMHVTAQF